LEKIKDTVSYNKPSSSSHSNSLQTKVLNYKNNNYAISFWVYVNPGSSNSIGYKKESTLLDYAGGKPKITYINDVKDKKKELIRKDCNTNKEYVEKLTKQYHSSSNEFIEDLKTKLRNCINNSGQMYREKLKSGKTKIFIITTEKSISALELSLNSKGIFEVVQLLSTCNRLPSEFHKNISVILTNEINILNLETQIEKLKDNSTLFTGLLSTVGDESTDNNTSPFGFELPDIRRVIDPEEELVVDIPTEVLEDYQPNIARIHRRGEMRVVRR
jgi:hypothetical protein